MDRRGASAFGASAASSASTSGKSVAFCGTLFRQVAMAVAIAAAARGSIGHLDRTSSTIFVTAKLSRSYAPAGFVLDFQPIWAFPMVAAVLKSGNSR